MEGQITVYTETENGKALFQEIDGYIFVHLEFYNWSPTVYKEILEESKGMFEMVKEKGYDMAFTYSSEKRFMKLWRKVRPVYEETTFEVEDQTFYMAAWDLED